MSLGNNRTNLLLCTTSPAFHTVAPKFKPSQCNILETYKTFRLSGRKKKSYFIVHLINIYNINLIKYYTLSKESHLKCKLKVISIKMQAFQRRKQKNISVL